MSIPGILTHPNIPLPLHGVNPRNIKGLKWWDSIRKKVYKKYDYCCAACGIHKTNAKGPKWLEAHEYWNIDYQTGRCSVDSIEPLCHYCHNFIHSGRLAKIIGLEKSEQVAREILEHGFEILHRHKLQCFEGTRELAEKIGAKTFGVEPYSIEVNIKLRWSDFYLEFEGEKYYSKFKNQQELEEHYDGTRKIIMSKPNMTGTDSTFLGPLISKYGQPLGFR